LGCNCNRGSANGVIVSCSHDTTVRIWDTREPPATECVSILTGHTSVVGGVQFDDDKIISGDFDGNLLAWDWRRLTLPKGGHIDDTKRNPNMGSDTSATATPPTTTGDGNKGNSIKLRKLPGFIDSLQWRDNTLIVGSFKHAVIINMLPSSSTEGLPIQPEASTHDASVSMGMVADQSTDVIIDCDETVGAVRLLSGQLQTEHKALIATDSSLQLYLRPSISSTIIANEYYNRTIPSHGIGRGAMATSVNSNGGVSSSHDYYRISGLSPLAMIANEQRIATTTAAGNLIVLDFDSHY
jgi:WD40 repeat protein